MDQSRQAQAVRRMIDYIDSHIDRPITMHGLAEQAWYSPWHCARIFNEATGFAPFSYIRMRRLVEAANRLQSPSVRIIDIALEFEFGTHEGFTRAFARQFGMTPAQFRERGMTIPHFSPQGFRGTPMHWMKENKIMNNKQNMQTVFVQVVELSERLMVVCHGRKAAEYFAYCEEVGCDVWDTLSAIPDAIHEPMGMWLPQSIRGNDTSEYVQGVEVPMDWSGTLPGGFDLLRLHSCTIMVFQGPPFKEEDFEQAIGDLWDIMNSYDPSQYGFAWAEEDGPRFQLAPAGYRGYIEGRPVRRI